MNILIGDIFFPSKEGIYLENGIRPPFLLQIWQILSAGFLNGLE